MPLLRKHLQSHKVPELKNFLDIAGVAYPNGRAKAPLVDILLVNLEAIPAQLRLLADPPVVLPEGAQPPPPPAPPQIMGSIPTAKSIASIVQERMMATMTPYLAAIAELQAKDHDRMEVDGGEQTVPATVSAASLPAGVPAYSLPEARIAFDHVSPTVMEAIVENRFDIKDLWKLDPMRIAEQSIPARGTFLAQLEQEMNDSEESQRSRARTKYSDLGQVLRPWLVYAQLRDLLAPESRIGWHLVNHARELLRLNAEYPTRWEGFLNYF